MIEMVSRYQIRSGGQAAREGAGLLEVAAAEEHCVHEQREQLP
jgi:hypothetical protein